MSMIVAPLFESGGVYTAASYVAIAVSLVLLLGAALLFIRAALGPTVFDRILAINSLGTKTVVLVTCFAFFDLRNSSPNFFIDTAIVYALINFVATLALLKYIEHGRLD